MSYIAITRSVVEASELEFKEGGDKTIGQQIDMMLAKAINEGMQGTPMLNEIRLKISKQDFHRFIVPMYAKTRR